MTRECFLKTEILQTYGSLKEFAKKIEMPYTTLLSIVNSSVGGASFDNITKICHGLNLDINTLNPFYNKPKQELNEADHTLITAYRAHPEAQASVNKLLDLDPPQSVGAVIGRPPEGTPAASLAADLADELKQVAARGLIKSKVP